MFNRYKKIKKSSIIDGVNEINKKRVLLNSFLKYESSIFFFLKKSLILI